ncbi:MAG: transcriptional repressor [Chlorobi bacterium]|nr:transcriptional repressor [Chlorobiota bacterium]
MQELLDAISRAGLKLTPRRRTIVCLFAESRQPLTPREVHSRLCMLFSRCGLPGVYRNLDSLAGCGVLFRLPGPGRERLYALCRTPGILHHHHIVCVSCGKAGTIDGCHYHEGMMIGGYRLLSHVTHFEGICPSCLGESEEGVRT